MSAALSFQVFDARVRAFDIFREEARRIWSNAEAVPVQLSLDEPGKGCLASVTTLGTPRSIGSRVLNPERTRTLRLSAEVLAFPPEALRKILIHEALHLGISGHGARFMRACALYGGARTGQEARGAPVVVACKEGRRFRVVREFPRESLNEARAFMVQQVRSTGIRHRITY